MAYGKDIELFLGKAIGKIYIFLLLNLLGVVS